MPSDAEIDAVVDAWQTTLKQVVDRVNANMAIYAAEFDSEEGRLQSTANNIARAAQVSEQLTAELQAAGYTGALQELSGNVARIVNEVAEGLPADQQPVLDSLVQAFQRDTVRTLDNAWFDITGMVRQAVEAAVLGQEPIDDLVTFLAGQAGGRAELRFKAATSPLQAPLSQWINWASAAVDTTISALNRMVQLEEAKQAGVEYFRYDGTLIATSRPFCRIMQGVVLTIAELNSIETDPRKAPLRRVRNGDGNGQPGIVQTLGGWRCRHILSPISLRRAKRRRYPIFEEVWPELVREAAEIVAETDAKRFERAHGYARRWGV